MNSPRILLWDIESSPMLAHVYERYEANVLNVEHDWHLLSVAWKWLGEKATHVKALPDFPERYAADIEDDYELAALAHRLFCEADVVVAHNGVAFDTKKAQARMIYHGFAPPTPFKEVDTLLVARRHFAFSSNRLGELCEFLGIGTKLENGGFKTWLGCLRGDPKAWALMKKYNRQDVVILEQLYLKLRPWMPRHPNIATLADRPTSCPKCGAEDSMQARGFIYSTVSRRQRYQCQSCGGWCAGRKIERVEAEYV